MQETPDTRVSLIALRAFAIAALLIGSGGVVSGAPAIFQSAGADAAAIAAGVQSYRDALDAQTGQHLELNWDGVPDDLASPNDLPGDYFNAASGPLSRGAVLTTPGTAVRVSADADNPTFTDVRFGDINPTYPTIFQTFSAERLFSPIGSNVVNLNFFVPGTSTPGLVAGFGAVYCDADVSGATSFEYFDAADKSLGVFQIPVADNGLSFLGVLFDQPVVHRVHIIYGSTALGPNDGDGTDVAVMDNFIYDRPQSAAAVPLPSAGLAALTAVPLIYLLRRNRSNHTPASAGLRSARHGFGAN